MNELTVKYETAYGMVQLDPETVQNYLVSGGSKLTDKEMRLFMELCKFQKLNPFVGEAYAVKFRDDFQMIVGYDAYKRRADENPAYHGKESGIVVQRGESIVQKKGTCLYPGEKLVGGWCKVFYDRSGRDMEEYREVSLEEYDKHMALWKSKPCTMIEKVAVSQALRAAFPKDYTGLYTSEEMGTNAPAPDPVEEPKKAEPIQTITSEERHALFDKAFEVYGKEDGINKVKELCAKYNVQSTDGMPVNIYFDIMDEIEADANSND